MIDPTAVPSLGDSYPIAARDHTDRLVVYDDELVLAPLNIVTDTTDIEFRALNEEIGDELERSGDYVVLLANIVNTFGKAGEYIRELIDVATWLGIPSETTGTPIGDLVVDGLSYLNAIYKHVIVSPWYVESHYLDRDAQWIIDRSGSGVFASETLPGNSSVQIISAGDIGDVENNPIEFGANCDGGLNSSFCHAYGSVIGVGGFDIYATGSSVELSAAATGLGAGSFSASGGEHKHVAASYNASKYSYFNPTPVDIGVGFSVGGTDRATFSADLGGFVSLDASLYKGGEGHFIWKHNQMVAVVLSLTSDLTKSQ